MGLLPDYKANTRLLVIDIALLFNSIANRTGYDTFSIAHKIADHLKLGEDYKRAIKKAKVNKANSEKKVAKHVVGALYDNALLYFVRGYFICSK